MKNRSKIDQKSIKFALGPQEAPRAPQDPPKPQHVRNVDLALGGQKGGQRDLVGLKNHQKAIQNACEILIDVDVHFSSIWHRFWRRFGRLLAAMLASKMKYNLSSNFE